MGELINRKDYQGLSAEDTAWVRKREYVDIRRDQSQLASAPGRMAIITPCAFYHEGKSPSPIPCHPLFPSPLSSANPSTQMRRQLKAPLCD